MLGVGTLLMTLFCDTFRGICKGDKVHGGRCWLLGRKPPLDSDHFRSILVHSVAANPVLKVHSFISQIFLGISVVVNIVLEVIKLGRQLKVHDQDQTTNINHTGSHISQRCTTFV